MTLPENVKCPECDGPMVSRTGKFGTFWGCKKYPECKGTRDSMGRSREEREEETRTQRVSEQERENGPERYPFRKS